MLFTHFKLFIYVYKRGPLKIFGLHRNVKTYVIKNICASKNIGPWEKNQSRYWRPSVSRSDDRFSDDQTSRAMHAVLLAAQHGDATGGHGDRFWFFGLEKSLIGETDVEARQCVGRDKQKGIHRGGMTPALLDYQS